MVLDTSIIIKLIRGISEPNTDKAIEYYKKFRNGEIALEFPDIMFYELANFASRQEDVTFSNCRELIENLFLMPVEIVSPDEKMIFDSLDLARDLKISTYDASYLAVAKRYNTKVVTCDKKLLQAAPDLTLSL